LPNAAHDRAVTVIVSAAIVSAAIVSAAIG